MLRQSIEACLFITPIEIAICRPSTSPSPSQKLNCAISTSTSNPNLEHRHKASIDLLKLEFPSVSQKSVSGLTLDQSCYGDASEKEVRNEYFKKIALSRPSPALTIPGSTQPSSIVEKSQRLPHPINNIVHAIPMLHRYITLTKLAERHLRLHLVHDGIDIRGDLLG